MNCASLVLDKVQACSAFNKLFLKHIDKHSYSISEGEVQGKST